MEHVLFSHSFTFPNYCLLWLLVDQVHHNGVHDSLFTENHVIQEYIHKGSIRTRARDSVNFSVILCEHLLLRLSFK